MNGSITTADKAVRGIGWLTFAFSVAIFIYVMGIYSNSFVHPHILEHHLTKLVTDGIWFKWSDFGKMFTEVAPGENRTRYLSYLFDLVDIRIHLIAEQYFVLHPAFSISWLFLLGIQPYLLYRLILNLVGDREAALIGVLPLFTSIGYLSNFAMYFQATKYMSNILTLACLYLTSEIAKKAKSGELLFEVRGRDKYWLVFFLVIGPFFDEEAYFSFVAPVVVFSGLFFGAPRERVLKNILKAFIPVIVFLILVLGILPHVTQSLYHYRLDYWKGLLGTGYAKSPTEGLLGIGFGFENVYVNLRSFLGTLVCPWPVCPLEVSQFGGGVISGQMRTSAQTLFLLGFFAALAWVTAKTKKSEGPRPLGIFVPWVLLLLMYVVFVSALAGRNLPMVTSYYYGSGLPIFVAPILAISYWVAKQQSARLRIAALLMISWIVVVQALNFIPINRSFEDFHNVWNTQLPLDWKYSIAKDRPVTRAELITIREAWQQGHILEYLKQEPVSPGAVYLLHDLHAIDRLRKTAPTAAG